MKILIDPMLAVLARDLSTEDKAEILMCVLEYPSRECEIGLWKYMKQQIDADAQKYKEKCERMAENGRRRWTTKSNPKSDMIWDSTSRVKKEVSKENIIIKNNCNESVSSNELPFVDNPVNNFRISGDFSFEGLCKQIPKVSDYLALHLPSVVERAERTIKQKRFGQCLSLQQILEWLEQENDFHKQNHRGQK